MKRLLGVAVCLLGLGISAGNVNSIEMTHIPGGNFLMGDTFGEGRSAELPVHSVYVSDFFMGKYEVTKALWDEVYTWAISNGYSFDNAGSGKAENHPVHSVNWYDIVKWCNAFSEKEGRAPCYTVGVSVYRTGQSAPSCDWNANGYRLPTEAEWERAARGGLNDQRFPWGNTINHDYANYRANGSTYSYDISPYTTDIFHPSYEYGSVPYSSPVGSFAPNGYGLYDMIGNMWAQCWDWYDDGYYASSPLSNPRGPSSGSAHVGRGGNWYNNAFFCRSAMRTQFTPAGSYNYAGLRVCMSAEGNCIGNGDFESGDTGFSSEFFNSGINQESSYTITINPGPLHGGARSLSDHTSGSGNMMAVNGSDIGVKTVWEQTVTVVPGNIYRFSMWLTDWSLSNHYAGLRVYPESVG